MRVIEHLTRHFDAIGSYSNKLELLDLLARDCNGPRLMSNRSFELLEYVQNFPGWFGHDPDDVMRVSMSIAWLSFPEKISGGNDLSATNPYKPGPVCLSFFVPHSLFLLY